MELPLTPLEFARRTRKLYPEREAVVDGELRLTYEQFFSRCDRANTFLGDYRLQQQRAACALWPRGSVPNNYAEPTRSKVPALILTGQWDPVTPPAYGDAAARSLPNSLHVIVPHGGHGFNGLDGIDCIDRLILAFIDSGTTKGLDTSCVGKIRRQGFVLKLAESKQ